MLPDYRYHGVLQSDVYRVERLRWTAVIATMAESRLRHAADERTRPDLTPGSEEAQ